MLLPPRATQWQRGALLETLRLKVQDIAALEARLPQRKAHLVTLIVETEAKPVEIDCTTNAKRVLSRIPEGKLASPVLESGDVKVLAKASRERPLGTR